MEWNTFCFICFHTEIVTNVKISEICIHLSHTLHDPCAFLRFPFCMLLILMFKIVYMRISDCFNSHFSSPRNNSQWRQWIQIRFMVCKSAMPALSLIQTAFNSKPTNYLTISFLWSWKINYWKYLARAEVKKRKNNL